MACCTPMAFSKGTAYGISQPGRITSYNVCYTKLLRIRESEQVRSILANYQTVEETIEIDLPDYSSLTKPFIEVFTLDSESCAACTYMMGAVDAIKAYFGDSIDTIEYKYTEKINIARCKKMGVSYNFV